MMQIFKNLIICASFCLGFYSLNATSAEEAVEITTWCTDNYPENYYGCLNGSLGILYPKSIIWGDHGYARYGRFRDHELRRKLPAQN